MANDKIETAAERGGTITAFTEHGRVLFTKPSGGTWASDGLVGYTPSSLSIRRGAFVYTYNEKGRYLQTHTVGPPTPKNRPAPARAPAPKPAPRPVVPEKRYDPMAPYAKSRPAPASASAAPAASLPAQRNKWFQAQQPIPIPTDPKEVVAYYDETGIEDDPGTDDDVQISEMIEAIPDEVRGLILTLERRRRRWKILAITFMILFSLPLLLIILALAVGK